MVDYNLRADDGKGFKVCIGFVQQLNQKWQTQFTRSSIYHRLLKQTDIRWHAQKCTSQPKYIKKKTAVAAVAATVTRHSAQTTQHFINKNIIKGCSCTNVFCMHLVYMLGNSAVSISFLRQFEYAEKQNQKKQQQ